MDTFIVAYVRSGTGLSTAEVQRISEAIAPFNPEWVQIVSPYGLLFLFTAEADLSRKLTETLNKACAASGGVELQYGLAEGELIVRRDNGGRVSGQPMGTAINRAIEEAARKAT